MSPVAETIFQTAAALPAQERAALVGRLLETLPNGADGVGVHTDEWMNEVEAAAAQSDEEDDARLTQALAAIRQQGKELARQGKR